MLVVLVLLTKQILTMMNAPFEHVNILADDSLRVGLKEYSQWPTFPQVASRLLLPVFVYGGHRMKLLSQRGMLHVQTCTFVLCTNRHLQSVRVLFITACTSRHCPLQVNRLQMQCLVGSALP